MGAEKDITEQISSTSVVRSHFSILDGGEGGIRTLDRLLTYTHFPGVLLKPLGHLSQDAYGPLVVDRGVDETRASRQE